jgi:hypothetical protein
LPSDRAPAILQRMTFAHDPTLLAWFVTAAYFVGAGLTFVAARGSAATTERSFWLGCAAILVLLGFNKQLDLQGYITTFGRSLAHNEGWYEQRRLVQTAFVIALSLVSAISLASLAVWLRRSPAAVKVAALGIVLLFTFILWRAASFHHMDVWVTRNIGGMRSGWWLELGGIILIGVAAAATCRRNRATLA